MTLKPPTRRATAAASAPQAGYDGVSRPRAPWWKHGVIYQVYPRSFQDSNGDGVGDLGGLLQRLDYLVDLGVDAVWLSPIYPSPMEDFGYDVTDHLGVDPLFGDLADFDRLVAALHDRGLKLILDYIPNHLSSRHPWFLESRSNRTNPRRDWFVWADTVPGRDAPNNWRSEFGGAAWTFEPARGQYYYHAFLPSQPDLNWRNPQVREAMLEVLRFWLDRGVDGFRVDAIHHLLEDPGLQDNPVNPLWREPMNPAEGLLRAHTADHPDVHGAIRAMREVVHAYGHDRVLIGEAYLPLERLMAYYGQAGDGFDLPFNFHLMSTPWSVTAVQALIAAYERLLPRQGWPNWVLGNHDRQRLASRLGALQARVAAMLLLTLRGTPTLYQGDELGLRDTPIAPDRIRDPLEKRLPGRRLGRDPVRTPLPWSRDEFAGFSSVEPWLPLSAGWEEQNVASQAAKPDSMLGLYRALLRLRREEPALQAGDYRPVAADGLLAYERQFGSDRLLVALDLDGSGGAYDITSGVVLQSLGHPMKGAIIHGRQRLPPAGGVIVRVFPEADTGEVIKC